MTLVELERFLGTATPLVFWTVNTGEPWFGGTCFRIRHERRLFVVTARHCIEGRVDISRARIQCGGLENEYFPLVSWHLMGTRSSEDTDQGDLAIFEVGCDLMTQGELDRVAALDADRDCWRPVLRRGQALLVEGYPSAISEMDYDLQRWVRGSRKLRAVYSGQSGLKGVAQIKCLDVSSYSDLDGFSGAPVFAIQKLTPDDYSAGFVGMMIRASYFITAESILAALTVAGTNDLQEGTANRSQPFRSETNGTS